MAEKNEGSSRHCNLVESDYEEYNDDEVSGIDYDLSLEKLNLGPKKKLLVLSLNGLLACRVFRGNFQEVPKHRRPDGRYGSYLVFERPFCQDFIKFCLERFEVGIWSSAIKYNVDEVLDYALGEMKTKLLFVWDQSQCSDSGFKCREKNDRPLFFKELKKVWEKIWKGGPYSEANTLLIDDQPYRALLNPLNTGIFPVSYNPAKEDDEALDPKGELGLYLKGLADSNDVQSYVKDHTFGQPAITSSHPHWSFYSLVLRFRSFRPN